MFDIRAIRDNPDAFRAAFERKQKGLGDVVSHMLDHDAAVRKAVSDKQEAEAARNAKSKEIGKAKASGDEALFEQLRKEVADAKDVIEAAGEQEAAARAELDELLLGTPNIPMPDVPEGEDEDSNVEQHQWGEPNALLGGRNQVSDHADLGAGLKNAIGLPLMDFEAAAAMSGARFVALRGQLARLERALASFMLDKQTLENGYEEVSPPLLVNDEAVVGTGQRPKFAGDLFAVVFGVDPFDKYAKKSPRDWGTRESVHQYVWSALQSIANVQEAIDGTSIDQVLMRVEIDDYNYPGPGETRVNNDEFAQRAKDLLGLFVGQNARAAANAFEKEIVKDLQNTTKRVVDTFSSSEQKWLIPTSEVPLTNLVREQILDAEKLPIRMTGHTPCFRSEAGSAGRDTKGMIRLHQFNKVEMVSIVRDEAEGLAELERMTKCAEGILEALDLPYRRMLLCTGDMGFGARKTYDLEVWLPSQNTYREISSCSYCGDFQARRMSARWRPAPSEDNTKPKPEFVHTLNGSGLAVGRTLVAVLENYQNEDGSITVPDVLRPYMGGLEVIS